MNKNPKRIHTLKSFLPTAGISLLVLLFTSSACVSGWAHEDAATDADLYAVFGVDGGDVWAVGSGGTVLVRRDTHWIQLDSGVETDLKGVWGTAAEHVVVVGDECTALEYNGEPEPDPETGEVPPDLRPLEVEGCPDFVAIDGVSPTDANAIGSSHIYWYNGSSVSRGGWHAENLLGICTTAQDDRHLCADEGLYKHYDGSEWKSHHISSCPVVLVDGKCPIEEEKPILWGVWAGSSGKGGLVGNSGGIWLLPPPEGDEQWSTIPTDISSDLRAVAGWQKSNGEVEMFAVGDGGVVYKIVDGKAKRQNVDISANLHSVWVSEDGTHVYAVGDGGKILHLIQ